MVSAMLWVRFLAVCRRQPTVRMLGIVASTKVVARKGIPYCGSDSACCRSGAGILSSFDNDSLLCIGRCNNFCIRIHHNDRYQADHNLSHWISAIQTIVGLAIALGMGVTQANAALATFPAWVTTIFGKSPVVLAMVTAVVLNLLLPKPKGSAVEPAEEKAE